MKWLLLTCMALGAMTSAALAEPIPLTAEEMDQATAGGLAAAWADAWALGIGTRTRTVTHSMAVDADVAEVMFAIGVGSALAAGPGAQAGADTGVAVTGEMLFGSTHSVGIALPGLSSFQSVSIGFGLSLF